MDDTRTDFSANSRKIGAMIQYRIDQGTGKMTGGGMNHQARLFVDDQDVVIFKDRHQVDGLRYRFDGFRRRESTGNGFTGFHPVSRLAGTAVNRDQTAPNQCRDVGTGLVGKLVGKKRIEPLTGIGFQDLYRKGVGFGHTRQTVFSGLRFLGEKGFDFGEDFVFRCPAGGGNFFDQQSLRGIVKFPFSKGKFLGQFEDMKLPENSGDVVE